MCLVLIWSNNLLPSLPDTTVVSILRNSSTPTNASSVSWTVNFADAIANLTSSNFTLVNGACGGTPAITSVTALPSAPSTQWIVVASTGSGDCTLGLNLTNATGLSHDLTNLPFTGQVYLLTPSGQGAVTADITAGSATDTANNFNTAATQFSRTYDTVSPTVSINQAAGQTDPTGVAPINFTVVFGEPVTGFGDSDVAISGTAAAPPTTSLSVG